MTGQAAVVDAWGEWMLGDLPEVLSMTIDLLGPSRKVGWIAIVPPKDSRSTPHVGVFVTEPDQVASLRREIETCGCVADFSADSTEDGWVAYVAGQSLQVEYVEETP